jgi:myo-inositol-1(or 4)-monophosphatase
MILKIIEIAKEAGSLIKGEFGKEISIELKTDEANLVTNVDKASEKLITDFIKMEYPSHSIIAEESGNSETFSDYTWIIDPIDGTTNFAHRLPIFAVSIGVLKGNELIAGVIYDVMRDVIYSAEKGSGSFENDRKLYVSSNSELLKSVLVTGFAYDREDGYREAVKIFGDFLNKSRAVRRLGSAALDFCYVASGVFDGFWEANLSPWDVAAGILIVQEAGGKVTDFKNHSVNPFSEQFLATNGMVHDEMIEIISNSKIK